jgi:hypothetical protein
MRSPSLAALVAVLGACGFQVASGVGGPGDASDAPPPDGDGDDAPTDAAPIDTPVTSIDAPIDGPQSTKRRVKLSFKNGSRNIGLDGFVVLVALDATKVDYSLIKAGGANIRFVDTDGTSLPYQIDEWAAGGTSLVWVRVPLIDASSDTDYIYMHYGDPTLNDAQNAAGTWAGYAGIYHLSQDPGPGGAGQIKDSSPAAKHGTATAVMTPADRVAGIVGNGYRLLGNGAGVDAASTALPTYTWSMWIKGTTAPSVQSSNREPINNGDVNFNFSWEHSQAAFVGAAAQKDAAQWRSVAPGTIAANTWYFLAGTYDGTNLCSYRDNAMSCTTAGAPLAPAGGLLIGHAASGSVTFNGWIDEVHITATAFGAKRLDAEIANQRHDPSNPFVVFGTPEVIP